YLLFTLLALQRQLREAVDVRIQRQEMPQHCTEQQHAATVEALFVDDDAHTDATTETAPLVWPDATNQRLTAQIDQTVDVLPAALPAVHDQQTQDVFECIEPRAHQRKMIQSELRDQRPRLHTQQVRRAMWCGLCQQVRCMHRAGAFQMQG